MVASKEVLVAVNVAFFEKFASQRTSNVGTTSVRSIPSAIDATPHHESESIWISPTGTLKSNSDMSQRHRIIAVTDLGSSISTGLKFGSPAVKGGRNITKVLFAEFL